MLSLIAQTTNDIGQEGLDLGNAYTLSDGTPVKELYSTPSTLINILVPNLFVIAGIAVMVMVMLAGYKFLLKGQQGIQDAVKIGITTAIGIVVMFTAYWIVQIIAQLTGASIPL
jgi:hypothetical protein